jgi:glutamate racemase
VLATRGTVARDYTHDLVREHAANCEVTLVGSPLLAVIAERVMRDEAVDEAEIAREIAPCFVEREGRRTDQIVLACTHFPLIVDRIERLSPWPVGFVDPAPAIARRLDALIGAPRSGGPTSREGAAIFTSGDKPQPALQKTLRLHGLAFTPAAKIGLSATA